MIRYWFVPDECFRACSDYHRAWTSRGLPAPRHRDDLRRQRGGPRLDITLDGHSRRVASPTRQPV
ncbi:hypothetical protein E1267_34090 [Nonomuraea longispora]|uniref:Uncharacterized protein n=1 Tax=Nonomuraea longispora TaxID=1848320 RepID=A0A4R4N0U3_9ACTN|nr:hypothetical protein [Nonomuraea longispora]TDC00633.1 hypothetical protein E1267_34090 [Nonomuraea longispora]